jgi:SAM-dependent methyltransferase
MDAIDLGEERFDVAVMNNSFCYVVDPAKRCAALDRTLRALRPGGVLVLREPKRLRVRDQFTGIPLLGLVPPRVAMGVSRILRLGRSDVRLLWGHAAKRELRVAGFVEVEITPTTGHTFFPTALSGYQHLVARRPRE